MAKTIRHKILEKLAYYSQVYSKVSVAFKLFVAFSKLKERKVTMRAKMFRTTIKQPCFQKLADCGQMIETNDALAVSIGNEVLIIQDC